jgi:tRNA nucleotidyltransferase (CCA-adding enzyme)
MTSRDQKPVVFTYKGPRAADLIGSPAETIQAGAPLRRCRDKMRRRDLDCVVVREGKKAVGLISRDAVERATEHRLGSKPVADFMSIPVVSVPPGATPSRLSHVMLESGMTHLLVRGATGPMGVISREDLLKACPPGEESFSGAAEDLSPLINRHFSAKALRMLRKVGRIGKDIGVRVLLVGGSVRDLLFRVPDVDLDIVVVGDGISFARKFVARHGGRMVAYRRFATAMMVLPGGLKIDVVSARSERYKRPGALPTIQTGALAQDLFRRDFTINSMAIELSPEKFGLLVDPFGGRRDLSRRVIRLMHNLSFVEDPTRIIRGVRFEGRYGFQMDGRTEYLLKIAARNRMLDRISGQRLREEILILLRERNPLPALRRLDSLGVWQSLSPELRLTKSLSGLLERIGRRLKRWTHLWSEGTVDPWIVYLLGLFSSFSSAEVDRLATRLCLHRKAVECLCRTRQAEAGTLRELAASRRPSNGELYRLLQPLPAEVLIFLMARDSRRTVTRRIVHYQVHLRPVRLKIGGEDLKGMGLVPGSIFKQILDDVLEAKLDGRLRNRSDELRLAAKLARAEGR